MNTSLIEQVSFRFEEEFDSKPKIYFAPGRINVIGEHLDYNGGSVLPAAIQMGVYVAIQNRKKGSSHIISGSFGESMRFVWGKYQPYPTGNWRNYVLGVLKYLEPYLPMHFEFDMMIDGDIPLGAGMSSSAALEVAIAFAMNDLFNLKLDLTTLAKIAHQAENQFVGVNCGIMDQFASALGKADSYLLLDCQTESYTYVEAHMDGTEWLLINSGVSHALADSGYNQRRKECENALRKLQSVEPSIDFLADRRVSNLLETANLNETENRRVEYVTDEVGRVDQVVKALKTNDTESVGSALSKAQMGMRDKYEISCPEIDSIIQGLAEIQEVLGARMMGGGFGGSIIALVQSGTTGAISQSLNALIDDELASNLSFHEVKISSGPRRLK